MSEHATNPFLFVVGCPRSGTTLLQRMLDSHPELGVANDTHFIPRCLEKVSPGWIGTAEAGQPIPLTPDLAGAVRSYHRFYRLGLDEGAIGQAHAGASTYQEFVSGLYSEFARRRGKRLGGEKTPDYVRHLALLHGLFPQARCIHIFRDGRDTALSLLSWANARKGPGRMSLWRSQPLGVCALWWKWLVRAGRQSAQAVPCLEVRYEQLVEQPQSVLRGIAEYLGLPFDPRMLAYHDGKTRARPGRSAKQAWLPPTSGLRDWRCEMAAAEVELFEALAGDLLAELGYELACSSISPQVEQTAAYCRAWWRSHMSRQQEKRAARCASH